MNFKKSVLLASVFLSVSVWAQPNTQSGTDECAIILRSTNLTPEQKVKLLQELEAAKTQSPYKDWSSLERNIKEKKLITCKNEHGYEVQLVGDAKRVMGAFINTPSIRGILTGLSGASSRTEYGTHYIASGRTGSNSTLWGLAVHSPDAQGKTWAEITKPKFFAFGHQTVAWVLCN